MKVMSLLENNDEYFMPNKCMIYKNQVNLHFVIIKGFKKLLLIFN